MAWWRAPAMPATALVIGNAEMQDAGLENHIRSLAGALPILCGDPRKVSPQDQVLCKRYADWLALMEEKYSIMRYRQDLPGYFEPALGGHDGFARIDREHFTGGILGFFRHGAVEAIRRVTLDGLPPERLYRVLDMDGVELLRLTGVQMETEGFDITIQEKFGGRLFEIAAATIE